nr:hypothetical protein Iba_chr12aCG9040 [Ipomoea batatas]
MPRRKERAKKRNHDVASTSQELEVDEHWDDEEDWEEDEQDTLAKSRSLQLSAMDLVKVARLKTILVWGGLYFDMSLLDSFGCHEGVQQLISNPQWSKERYHNKPSISFTLFNKEYKISVNELGVFLGLHTDGEQRCSGYLGYCTDFDTNKEFKAYWRRLYNGVVVWDAAKTNAKYIVRNDMKAISLELEGKLWREWRIALMSWITIADINRAKLTYFEHARHSFNSHFATVHDWESMQSFQYQLYLEHMAELRSQREEIWRHGQAIEELQVQFTKHFHRTSFDGGDMQ